jgi:hypothetical protein
VSGLSLTTAGGIPACFQTARYGTNQATFRYLGHGGPAGAGAELVGVSAISFGLALRSDGTVATTRYSLVPVRYGSTRLIALSVVVAALVVVPMATRRLRRRGRPGSSPR